MPAMAQTYEVQTTMLEVLLLVGIVLYDSVLISKLWGQSEHTVTIPVSPTRN